MDELDVIFSSVGFDLKKSTIRSPFQTKIGVSITASTNRKTNPIK
jgi:hypothetical protein